ncbi:MAG TPA: ATP-binding protein [Haliscomenobacter sp.]|nr:ATP-binding protein [Haliscomenobacter sp.]
MPRSLVFPSNAFIVLLFILVCVQIGHSQPIPPDQNYIDSITPLLPKLPNDRIKVDHLAKLAGMNTPSNMMLAIRYAQAGLKISERIDYTRGIIESLGTAAFCHAVMGEWPKATIEVNRAMPLCKNEYAPFQIYMYNIMYIVSATKGELDAIKWVKKILVHPEFASFSEYEKWPTYMQLGRSYVDLNQLDSAEYYANLLDSYVKKYAHLSPDLVNNSYVIAGSVALRRKNYPKALFNFRQANDHLGKAAVFVELGQPDSVVFYGTKTLVAGQTSKIPNVVREAAKLLAKHFSKSDPVQANQYLNLYIETNEKLFSAQRLKQLEQISLNEQQAKFNLEQKEKAYRNRFLVFGLLFILIVSGIILFLLWRNNRYRKSVNETLQRTLNDLRTTQNQLIQSEKLASLGELTAGIAHEIQNPLNFVNNFAEVSAEMLGEMKEEIKAGNTSEVIAIADDLEQNLSKINHHGQRAASIVKGMLEHSRASTGVKEPTDLNALADEYLRLAYHGLRAKDSSFNAMMVTHFEPDLPLVSVIPQDIGRVLLNLINNAFYAVNEKAKQGIEDYQPIVTVSTRLRLRSATEDAIEISVKDNGNGIPEAIKEKIFQPFFTTKPTGQGTGLGLSLAYDIVMQGHGGTLTVSSIPRTETIFEIQLPIHETNR